VAADATAFGDRSAPFMLSIERHLVGSSRRRRQCVVGAQILE